MDDFFHGTCLSRRHQGRGDGQRSAEEEKTLKRQTQVCLIGAACVVGFGGAFTLTCEIIVTCFSDWVKAQYLGVQEGNAMRKFENVSQIA